MRPCGMWRWNLLISDPTFFKFNVDYPRMKVTYEHAYTYTGKALELRSAFEVLILGNNN